MHHNVTDSGTVMCYDFCHIAHDQHRS